MITEQITLTGKQLRYLADIINPDIGDEEQEESPMFIKWCHFGEIKEEGTMFPCPAGYYAWHEDDMELGAYPL